MTDIPSNHPRFHSLRLRHRLIEGLRTGLASEAGLLAQGRGEAFDYLLGERTHDFAEEAIRTASALLVTAKRPVFSVNGSAASLAGPEILELVRAYSPLVVEVNLFYHSQDRSRRVADYLRGLGVPRVVESSSPESLSLPGVQHARKHMHIEGIAAADVVLVALEDGDRCCALAESGRQVVAVDLNPMSRTARAAHVTVVDELTRALSLLTARVEADRHLPPKELADRITAYDNMAVLNRAIAVIRGGAGSNCPASD